MQGPACFVCADLTQTTRHLFLPGREVARMKGARCAGAGRWWRRLSIALAATGAALAGTSDWRPQSVSVTVGQTTTVDATLKTYHECIERGWPADQRPPRDELPAYVYNQIKVPGPQGGAYFVDAFNVLIRQAAISASRHRHPLERSREYRRSSPFASSKHMHHLRRNDGIKRKRWD